METRKQQRRIVAVLSTSMVISIGFFLLYLNCRNMNTPKSNYSYELTNNRSLFDPRVTAEYYTMDSVWAHPVHHASLFVNGRRETDFYYGEHSAERKFESGVTLLEMPPDEYVFVAKSCDMEPVLTEQFKLKLGDVLHLKFYLYEPWANFPDF